MVGTRCVGVSRWSYLAPEASDGKVLCVHKPQSKPHLSEPGTHQRTWRVMGRPARQKTQTLSMTRRNDRTRHDHAAAPLAVCPFCFFGGVRCGGLTGGWWIQWNEVLAVFVEGFLLTFAGGVVILKIHIWEHSGPFGYLIPIWLVV